jgi:hypothetical protein
MVIIHFVKDGKKANGERMTKSHYVSIHAITKHLGQFSTRYTVRAPTFNFEEEASDFLPYKHVVVEVEARNVNPSFPKPGFYYVVGLAPSKCRRLLGISAPTV